MNKVKHLDGAFYIREDFFDDQRVKDLLKVDNGADLLVMYFELCPYLQDKMGFDEALTVLMPHFCDVNKILDGILWLKHYGLISFAVDTGFNCYIIENPEE